MGAHAVVLCIQDTTELDFNGQEIAGLGPLSYEAQGGMYLHPTYAVTPEREPHGMLVAWMWANEKRGKDGVRPGAHGESPLGRRLRTHHRASPTGLPGTRLVYVADREAHMVELMRVARDLGTPADWLVQRSMTDTSSIIRPASCGPPRQPARRWARSVSPWADAKSTRRVKCASRCRRGRS